VDRLSEREPGFTLTVDNAEAVATIARRLEGLPLAIELAAQGHNTSLPALSNLSGDSLDLPPVPASYPWRRHATLRSAVEWSYLLLTPAQQRALCRLSFLSGDWSLEEALVLLRPESPTASQPEHWFEVLDDFRALVRHSLVLRSAPENTVRFRMLEIVRAFGQEQLRRHGEAEAGVPVARRSR
ncbi:MAG TPA: hypothetical protein VFY54_22645, partial [Rubrobacter sp.]|nr:hypothetical protein [Rubrobacter sp.]